MKQEDIQNTYFNPSAPGSFSAISGFLRNHKFKDKKTVEKTLNDLKTFSLHKPIRKVWIRRKVIVATSRDVCATDLIDVSNLSSENDNKNWILLIVDVFSKYLWAYEMSTKSADSVYRVFAKHFKQKDRRCNRLWSDSGKEYLNAKVKGLLDKYNIRNYQSYSKLKSVIAERYVNIIRTKLQRYFTFKGNNRCIEVLPQLVDSLNNTYQVRLGMTPSQVTPLTEYMAWYNQYKSLIGKPLKNPKYKIDQLVRISRQKLLFEKSFMRNFVTEVFRIKAVNPTLPVPTYNLVDLKNEEISGSFYAEELTAVNSTEINETL